MMGEVDIRGALKENMLMKFYLDKVNMERDKNSMIKNHR
jgi:hypothetical protein